jgi:hypothetical protein
MKKKLPTFLSKHIEYFIWHVPHTASISTCVLAAAGTCLQANAKEFWGGGEICRRQRDLISLIFSLISL